MPSTPCKHWAVRRIIACFVYSFCGIFPLRDRLFLLILLFIPSIFSSFFTTLHFTAVIPLYENHVKSTTTSLLNQSKIYKIKTALPYRQVHDGPKSKQFLKKQFQPSSRLFRIFRRPESRETEISLAARSKPFSGRSHYLDFIKQVIKKLPASHSIRAFHPNIRSVFPPQYQMPSRSSTSVRHLPFFL